MEGGAATKSYRYYWAEPPYDSATRKETAADRRAQLAAERDWETAIAEGLMDWSTKAKAKKAWEARNPIERAARNQLERVGGRVETAAGNAAAKAAQQAANWAMRNPEKVAAGAVAVGVTAAAVAAGATSYFLTRLSTEGARMGREAKVQLVNQLYRDAVSKMRRELGRNPTVEEIKPLAAEWRRRLADAEANVPTMQRAGRE